MKFSLRTLFVFVTLSAFLLWLCRCGQIDAGIGRGVFGPNWYVRVFSIEATIQSWQDFRLVRVVGWINSEGRALDDAAPRWSGISPGDRQFTRETHPWTSRDWHPHVIVPLIRVEFGDAFAKFAPSIPSTSYFTDPLNDVMNMPAAAMLED